MILKIYTYKNSIKKLFIARKDINFSIHRYRKSFLFKVITAFTGLSMLFQVFYPTAALALTGGPSQPEMQGFEPVSQTNMVDLSTGSFTYNIPLMDVEGYPITLAYHSGITMEQEASWVGLGWNINPGVINRTVRGLPDDFAGDPVTQQYNLKPDVTVGLDYGTVAKFLGTPLPPSFHGGIFYNNYKGAGIDIGLNASLSAGSSTQGALTAGLDLNSQSGVNAFIGMGVNMNSIANSGHNLGLNVGASYNSRAGITALGISGSVGNSPTLFGSLYSMQPTYIPTITMPINNYSLTLNYTPGVEFFGLFTGGAITGYTTIQSLVTNSVSHPAYGYMNADLAGNDENALHDFNREKDVPYQPKMANLPITNFTYDLYNVSGEGMGGQFRPFRGDVGILYDHKSTDQSFSADLGLELGFGWISHVGVDVSLNYSNTTTDRWTASNQFNSTVSFIGLQPNNINYEPSYFKAIGDKTVNDTSYYKSINGASAMRVNIFQTGATVGAQSVLFNGLGTFLNVPNNLQKTRRDKRNRSLSMLSVREATDFALDKTINSYPYNKNVYDSGCASMAKVTQEPRATWPNQHTSEITVTNDDGKRYVYGIPAYNTLQKEVSFAVNQPSGSNNYASDSGNMVQYYSGDNSTSNGKGIDNYYNSVTLPPYAHSYLLTEVLSPDYVDLTNNGVSDDDLGQAVKFNYTCMYNNANPYRWRIPYEHDSANYQQQFISDNQYDKANYIYGTKEIWYAHSIESKTMVAQFILQSRQDALGVVDENGGKDASQQLQCVKEINLYSKADLIQHGSKAVPIKTVHFIYDYSECPNTPNSNAPTTKGKLTLKQIYFTYGNNTEGALNSYYFNYSSFNQPYNHNQTDRWGNYKYNPPGMPSNMYFPYTLQDSARTNKFVTAWEMTGITLPSGGTIKVDYESNDYAYVQNQRAAQMLLISGVNSTASTSGMSGSLYNYSILTNKANYNDWLIVHLPTHCSSTTDFNNKYLEGISKLYFRFLTDLDHKGHYEYVPGYADIVTTSLINDSTGAIQLAEPTNTGSNLVSKANPISLAAWQYVRLNLPGYAYPGSNTSGNPFNLIMSLLAIATDVIQTVTGFDTYALAGNFGKNIIPGYSYIRLDNPNYKKYGGGCRVREIDVSDSWSSMTGSQQSSFTYGQTYNYTTTITNAGGKTQTISSGVATYEPLLGGDENPLRQPMPYDEQYLLAPNNNYYTETPLGEELYPAPGIVYSQVTVSNLKYPGVNRTATGSTVSQFYTAYDFPTLNSYTLLDNKPIKPGWLLSILGYGIENYTTASQGFTVEVNDMPGKLKRQEVFDKNGGAPISSIEYDYKVDNASVPNMHLNNNVSVVNPDGSIGAATVGEDIDMCADMREQESYTFGLGGSYNNDFFILPFFIPIPVDFPSFFPSFNYQHTRFRSAATTKYVHRTGLLDHIVKTENGSQVTTQNLLYDNETGDVLLTQTNNEFNKPVYSFNYPAHWVYDGMGSAYRNIGAYVSGVRTTSTGAIRTPASPSTYFAPGDEIESYIIGSGYLTTRAWITQPYPNDSLVVIDSKGKPVVLPNATVKVIRSGRRNMQSTSIGQIVSLLSPAGNKKLYIKDSLQILQASGTVFNNQWKVPTNNVLQQVCTASSSPPDSCIAMFFDSLEVHKQIYATPGDSIKFGTYAPSCTTYANELYYALTPRQGEDQGKIFQAALGGCTITITPYLVGGGFREGTIPVINFDSLGTFISVFLTEGKYATSVTQGTDTTGGCINLYKEELNGLLINHDCHCGSPGHTVTYPLIGQMCISCTSCTNVCTNLAVDSVMNPYAIGMLGNWRPEMNYVYYDSRSPALASTSSNIWNTGIFNHFNQALWSPPSGGGLWTLDTADKAWVWANQVTQYDAKGNEVEQVNKIGVYSSALFGYLQSMPIAQSANAKYKEIAFDGFEDYGFNNNCTSICDNSHFSFINYLADTTSAQAHTGKYSLKINSGTFDSVTRSINYYTGALDSVDVTHHNKYYLLPGGNTPLFSPDSGNYLLSAWVKENVSCGTTGYTKDSIVVSYTNSTAKYIMKPSGPVIEGWQRFESKFTVPGKAKSITVKLIAGTHTAYYDDIRIEPFAAEMETYVYDPSSLRRLAVLDENNYATIYEYNDEGVLMRVKKETERGIMTIKETRSSYPRK